MRIKQPISKKWHVFFGFIGILSIIFVYCALCYLQKSKNPSDTTMPDLYQFKKGFHQIFESKISDLQALTNPDMEPEPSWFIKDSAATYGRLFKSMVWGSVLAFTIGVLMGCFEVVESLFSWTLSFLSKIPPPSLLAVFLVISNIFQWDQDIMFIILAGFGIMPTLTQSIYLAAKYDPHEDEIDKVYTLGASNIEVIYDVVIHKIFPKFIDAIRLTIGPAMVYLIAAEYSLGHEGFGYRIRMQGRLLNMSVVYFYIGFLGTTGLILDQLLIVARRTFCPWYGTGGWKSPLIDKFIIATKWIFVAIVASFLIFKAWEMI